ncbi:MAG: PE domain-containing protein [Pseudonocardia sp.]
MPVPYPGTQVAFTGTVAQIREPVLAGPGHPVVADAALLDIRQAMAGFETARLIEPPGQDPVSVNLAEQMREMDRRAGQYVQAWAGQVELFRDAVQAQVDSYRRVDADNAGRLA